MRREILTGTVLDALEIACRQAVRMASPSPSPVEGPVQTEAALPVQVAADAIEVAEIGVRAVAVAVAVQAAAAVVGQHLPCSASSEYDEHQSWDRHYHSQSSKNPFLYRLMVEGSFRSMGSMRDYGGQSSIKEVTA